jgi:hypothetical protein
VWEHQGGLPTRHHLALVGSWLGLCGFLGGAQPRFGGWMGLCLVSLRKICFMLSESRLLLCFPLVFKIYALQNMFLPIQVELGQ